MKHRLPVVGAVVIFAALAGGIGLVYYLGGPSRPNGRQLTYEELTQATPPPDVAIQAALEKLGGVAVRHGDTAPIVQVSLADRPVTDADLAVLRGLEYVQDVRLSGTKVTDAGLAVLKDLKHLRRLDLSRTAVTGAGLAGFSKPNEVLDINLAETKVTDAELAGLAGFPGLQRLDLSKTAVTGTGLAPLKELPELWTILLAGTKVTDAGLAAFRDYPKVPAARTNVFRVIDLSDTGVTDAGVEALRGFDVGDLLLARTKVTGRIVSTLKAFPRLKMLAVEGTNFTPGELTELMKSFTVDVGTTGDAWKTDAGLRDLRKSYGPDAFAVLVEERLVKYEGVMDPEPDAVPVLDLSGSPVSDAGLAELKGYHGYTVLHLGKTKVTDAGLAGLADHLKLRGLSLDGTGVTDGGLDRVAGFKLETLSLRQTAVTDAGLRALGRAGTLKRLDLTGTKVTDAGLSALAPLGHLESLCLGETAVTDAGVKQLEGFKKLRYVNLSGAKVSDAALAGLKAALPDCEVSTASCMPAIFIKKAALQRVPGAAPPLGGPPPGAAGPGGPG